MKALSRRAMGKTTLLALGTSMVNSKEVKAEASMKRKFTLDLRCSSIGVRANQKQAIAFASESGFESVTPNPSELAKLDASAREELLSSLKGKSLTWGAAGLPVDFRKDFATFRSGFQNLPALAEAMQASGVSRVGTWLMPCHDDLTYTANFRQHVGRLRDCAKVLADHGQRLGLEYVGPKTLWTSKRYSFVHSMSETKELIAEINMDNVGFVLDSWHWYTAHETVDDLKSLTNKDVVACDLNDAPKGKSIDEQVDNQRELPAATGVIDLKAFLTALAEIEYDGPVRAEPFNKPLNEMENEAACAATAVAMRKAFKLIGG